MESAAAGPEELHRAVPALVKARLRVVAVRKPPGDVLGKEIRALSSARPNSSTTMRKAGVISFFIIIGRGASRPPN